MRMSNLTRVVAPLALTALGTVPAFAQFEGVVNLQMGRRQIPVTQTIKGKMVRTDMSGERGSGTMIMDTEARTMTMVMDEQKMYMTMDLKGRAEGRRDGKMPKFTDTGKSETIAGKSCQVYRMASDPDKPDNFEICAAKGMGFFMGGGRGPMGRGQGGDDGDVQAIMANPEFAKMYKDGFFPLRMGRIRDGQVTTTLLVTKIEEKKVDPSVFEVPAGYQKMEMPAGMPGMGPGGPPQN